MNRIEYKEGIIWCGEEKASNQLSTLAVSYTHLTLPTN